MNYHGSLLTLVDPLSGRSWRVPADRLDPWHVITIRHDGWHLTHPITCGLSRCEFDDEARGWGAMPAPPGKYQWSRRDEDPLLWRWVGEVDDE